ncbi:hypothetical protein E2320_010659, partial [Naja naja]
RIPLAHALTVFTDGSPTRGVVVWQAPLAAAVLALQLFSDQPINLIVDTQYVYLAMQSPPYSYYALHLDFTWNYLIVSDSFTELPVNLHFRAEAPLEKPWVKYRQAPNPKWKGPARLITWGCGYVTMEAPHNRQAIWISACCIRPYHGLAPGSTQSAPENG